jgi:protein-tyrosine phosphatase
MSEGQVKMIYRETRMKLLQISEMPYIDGLFTPGRFYQVIKEPAPLAGMSYPRDPFPWALLPYFGYKYVVSLTAEQPDYDPSPVQFLHTTALQDLYGGLDPDDPQREIDLIEGVVTAVYEQVSQGVGVAVHCQGGTGRTGTVLGGVLCRLGFPVDVVIHYLNRLTYHRGRIDGWPESPWQGEALRRLCGR